MRKKGTATGVALLAALGGCMDLDLLDELVPGDGGAPEAAGAAATSPPGGGAGGGVPDTDSSDTAAPELVGTACAASETAIGGACAAPGRGAISLRLTTDEPASIGVSPPGGARAEVLSAPWSVEHLVVAAGLEPGVAAALSLEIADVNGNAAAHGFEAVALDGPAVAITEVLADPLGPEPAQEFVEIANTGPVEIDLSGWMIDDGGDYDGDLLPGGTVLAAGGVALLVAPSFDPACADDPAPAAGALIVALESSIGTSGLSNSSVETVELYDPYGALVSAYDGRLGDPVEAGSAARVRAELPDGCPFAFGDGAKRPASPGSAAFVP